MAVISTAMAPLVHINPPHFAGPEDRRIARTSILVAAMLRFGTQGLAVRIRNMSPTGALIEGTMLPKPNCRIELVRGALRVSGRVAWVDGHRCGVAFDELVEVESWIAGKAVAHQTAVDARIANARHSIGAATGPGAAGEEPPPGIDRPGVATADAIDAIIACLARLGDRLADDPLVVASHLVELQALDDAQQRLAALKRGLA